MGWPFWCGQCGSRGLDNWRERTNHGLVEAEVYSSLARVLGAEYPQAKLDSLWHEAMTLLPHDGLYVSAQDIEEGVQLGKFVVFECEQLRRRAIEPLLRRIKVSGGPRAIVNDPGEHMAAGARNSYKEIWALVDVEVPAMSYTTLMVLPWQSGLLQER